MTAKHTWLFITALCGILAPCASAVQPGPLPPFQVTALDGMIVQSTQLAPDSQWLIVYLQSECHPCEAVLQLVKQKQEHPNLPRRMVIIGGMTVAALNALSLKYPDLAGARWVADTTGVALKQIKFAGAPTVIGLKGQNIVWTINGILSDPRQYKSILETWTN